MRSIFVDRYRMQLWGKMGAQNHAHQSSQAQSQAQPNTHTHTTHLTGLAANLRPHYFHGSSVGLSGLLSGKNSSFHPYSSYYTPSSSSSHPASVPAINKVLSNSTNIPVSSSSTTVSIPVAGNGARPNPSPEQAVLAAMASQTLVRKLGS